MTVVSEQPKINMGEVDAARRALLAGFDNVPPELLKQITKAALLALHKVNWNKYNEQRYGRVPVAIQDAIFLPDLPPVPKPFRSWAEVEAFVFGGLKDCEYESKEYKMKYVVEHNFLPDGIDPNNDRLIYEVKGVFGDINEAMKYVHVAKQNHVHFIFVLQEKGITVPFSKPRVNGTRQTMEEWIKQKKFSFCYVGEEETFRKTTEYQRLVTHFGKGLNSLKDALRTTSSATLH
jgi:hypothetical protein